MENNPYGTFLEVVYTMMWDVPDFAIRSFQLVLWHHLSEFSALVMNLLSSKDILIVSSELSLKSWSYCCNSSSSRFATETLFAVT